MNSTQHSIRRSRESFAKVIPGSVARMSWTIFCTVAATRLAASTSSILPSLHTLWQRQVVVAPKLAVRHGGRLRELCVYVLWLVFQQRRSSGSHRATKSKNAPGGPTFSRTPRSLVLLVFIVN
jgi:hypothetical protein